MQTINPNSFHFIHNNNNNSSDIDIVDSNDHNITFTMHRYLQPIIKNSSSSSSKKTTTKTFDDDFELKDSEQEELKRTNKDDYDNAIDIDNQPTSLPSPTIQSRQTSSTIQQQPQQQQQQQSSSAWRLGSSTCVLGERIAVVDSLEFYKGLKIKGIDYYTDSTVLLSFNDGNGGQNNNKPSVYKISSFYENITNKQLFIELIIVQRSDECGKKSSSAKQLFPTKRSISVKVTDITRITMCTIEPENQIKSKPSLPMNGFFCSDADYAELINAKGKKRSMYDKIIFSTPTSSQIDEGNNSSTQVVDQDEITPTQKRKSDFIDLEEFDFNNNNNNSNNDPSKEKLSKTADVQVKSKKDNIIKDIEQEEEEEEKEDILKEKPRRLKRLKKAKDNNNISIDIDSENDDNAQGNNHTSTSSSQERKLILSPQKKLKRKNHP
ncbi:hypothetical protein CYY_001487 [Polysphondylium violaceum]|uniref:Uncharacterized protein n=1 Tax=Polysphondylium violaceum TaxID=133409 RepID=A0A8J4V454_9MYCE|nr:hypothetical protein CYY_001487 [Polysphondylium violaceum]